MEEIELEKVVEENNEVEANEVEANVVEVSEETVEVVEVQTEEYYDDYEDEITKEELLAQLKEVYQEIDTKEALNYQRQWRRLESWESAYDDALNEEFFSLVDHSFSKIKEEQKGNEEAKLQLIDDAKKHLNTKNFNESTKAMGELMSAWKQVRSAGRDKDQQLWEEFNQARQAFYDLKAKNYQLLQEKFVKSKEIKEELIKEVAVLKDSTDYKATTNRLNTIMNNWKAAGSSGREHDDRLWQEFNDLRQVFYDNKKKHFASLEEKYKENNEEKKKLIEKARAVADEKYYSRENTDKIKAYTQEWKSIGFSGKEYDDANWKEFKMLTDLYFNELKVYLDERAQMHQQRQIERKAYLHSKIERQRRRIEKIRFDISISMSERESDELEAKVVEIKEYISEIETELKEM